MREQPYNVLFLCTHNSARSVIAECVMKRLGAGKFKAFSAGSQPSGKIHPNAFELLQQLNYDTSGLRSKSWEEFAQPGAPQLFSCSRFAMTQPRRSVRCGRASL